MCTETATSHSSLVSESLLCGHELRESCTNHLERNIFTASRVFYHERKDVHNQTKEGGLVMCLWMEWFASMFLYMVELTNACRTQAGSVWHYAVICVSVLSFAHKVYIC